MTQEEKDLLLKDLCARLPYSIMCNHYNRNEIIANISDKGFYQPMSRDGWHIIEEIKPYLRPMSSMTEEEYNKYELTFDNVVVYSGHNNNNIYSEHRPTYETFDYLDSIHVDYRDLIPKGLALPAPEGMYNIK